MIRFEIKQVDIIPGSFSTFTFCNECHKACTDAIAFGKVISKAVTEKRFSITANTWFVHVAYDLR